MSFPFWGVWMQRFHLKNSDLTELQLSLPCSAALPRFRCRFKTGASQVQPAWYILISIDIQRLTWLTVDPGDAGPGKNTRVNNIPQKKIEPPRDHCLLKHGLNLHALSIIMKPKAPNMLLPQDDFYGGEETNSTSVKLMWSCLDASKQYHWGALMRWSLEWYFCRNHPFWPSIMFRSGQHAAVPQYKNINVHLSELFLNAKQIFCHQIYKNAEAHQKTHNWKVQSWHCKCSQLLFCEPSTSSKHTQKTQRTLSLRRILNLIEDVVLLASNFESWNRRKPHGVKHQSLSMFNPRAILSTCNPLCFLGLNHLATSNMVKHFSN